MTELSIVGMTVLKGFIALSIGLLNVLVFLYMERKVLGRMHVRHGPMRAGPHGVLQPIADALKLILKEDIIPIGADEMLFKLAPIMAFVPSVMVYMVIPISENMVASSLDLGFFYLFGVFTVVPVGVLMAGWASYSKYSLLGGLRAAAQQISYEAPLLVSILGIIMITGSFSLTEVVKAQQGFISVFGLSIVPRWFIFVQPFGFILYFIAALADVERTPFDMPEAESELVQGYSTEYSGMRFAIFFLGEYSNAIVVSAICVIAFFGGWSGPLLPGVFWFFLKTYMFVFLIIWLKATLPRIRMDQLMDMGWKVLLPLTLINTVVTGFFLIK